MSELKQAIEQAIIDLDCRNFYDDSPRSADECSTTTEKEMFVIMERVRMDLKKALEAV